MKTMLVCLVLILSCSQVFSQAKAVSSTQGTHAQWSPQVKQELGVDKDEFELTGLNKLTDDQLFSLLSLAFSNNVSRAEAVFGCGPSNVSDDKVNVLVTSVEGAPDELQSALLIKLRSIPDINVVYDRDDADVQVILLGIKTKNTSGYDIGFASTVIYTDVCRASIAGSKPSPIDSLNGAVILTNPTAAEFADDAFATLNVSAFEPVRKRHAMFKKSN